MLRYPFQYELKTAGSWSGNEMKLKKLRAAVLAEHGKVAGGAGKDDARTMFKKRLKRLDGVTITGKMVKLGS